MLHIRVVVHPDQAGRVREFLRSADGVRSLSALGPVSERPHGEVFLCDLEEDRSETIVDELQDLVVPWDGLIAVHQLGLEVSGGTSARSGAVPGRHILAWENVEAQTSESTALSPGYLVFMVLAMLIGASGIVLDTATLVVGAMIVGPDFGPLAGTCVAVLERRARPAARSLAALAAGFAVGIAVTAAVAVGMKSGGIIGPVLAESPRTLTPSIAQVVTPPGFFSFFVAAVAGIAGMLSLSTSKSSALIGVLVSVTTIPAAANIALAIVYARWEVALGSLGQLGANLGTLLVFGTATLAVQRLAAARRHAGPGARTRDTRAVGS